MKNFQQMTIALLVLTGLGTVTVALTAILSGYDGYINMKAGREGVQVTIQRSTDLQKSLPSVD